MSDLTYPPITTYPDISDVYSSGTWYSASPSASGGENQPIFRNGTSSSIYAFVTICNEANPQVPSSVVQLYKGPALEGYINPGTCMGFFLSISPGQYLYVTQDVVAGLAPGMGTFVIAHVYRDSPNRAPIGSREP
jgi:hypothetical protein